MSKEYCLRSISPAGTYLEVQCRGPEVQPRRGLYATFISRQTLLLTLLSYCLKTNVQANSFVMSHLKSKMFTLFIIIANISATLKCFCLWLWSFESFEDLQHINLTLLAFCFTQYHIKICTENIQ